MAGSDDYIRRPGTEHVPSFLIGGSRGGLNKFGRNPEIDTANAADLWDLGTPAGGGGQPTWLAPTVARVHAIVSTSDTDGKTGAPSSAGARTIRVYGLTGWGAAETSEDITLDGTTAVNTTASYVIIHRMQVLTAGSSGPNVGVITATAATDATVTAQVNATNGQTLMAIYGIPSNRSLAIANYYAGINALTTGRMNVFMLVNPEPDANASTWLVKHVLGSTGDVFTQQFVPPFVVRGPAIVKLRADVTANNTDVSGGFNGVVLSNPI